MGRATCVNCSTFGIARTKDSTALAKLIIKSCIVSMSDLSKLLYIFQCVAACAYASSGKMRTCAARISHDGAFVVSSIRCAGMQAELVSECQLPECQLPKRQLPKMSTPEMPTPKMSTSQTLKFMSS